MLRSRVGFRGTALALGVLCVWLAAMQAGAAEVRWTPSLAPAGPLLMLVRLDRQRIDVFRNGVAIGSSPISSGRAGYETPTGVFTILQKDRDHRSNRYNDAPMPHMARLTWDGVALHGGLVPGYPASHGCSRVEGANRSAAPPPDWAVWEVCPRRDSTGETEQGPSMRCLLFAALCGMPILAGAADPILRCVTADGHVVFTQHQCPVGAKLTRKVEVTPDLPRDGSARTWQQQAQEQQRILRREPADQSWYFSAGDPRVPDARDRQREHCLQVRKDVESERKRRGVGATFGEVRNWDDRVQTACKGL